MAKIYKNAAELVGNTPLLEVGNIEKDLGLEAKVLESIEACLFAEDGNVELSAFHNHIVSEIIFIHGDAYSVRCRSYLPCSIDYTAIILFPATCCEHEQSIG